MKTTSWIVIATLGLSPGVFAGCRTHRHSGERAHVHAEAKPVDLAPADVPAVAPAPASPPVVVAEVTPAPARTRPIPPWARRARPQATQTPLPSLGTSPSTTPVEAPANEAAWLHRELDGVAAELARNASASAPPPAQEPFVLEPTREGPPHLDLPPIVLSEMVNNGEHDLSMRARVCVSAQGVPTSARIARSTGYDLADQHLKAEIMRWRYAPLSVDGKALPFCKPVELEFHVRG